MVDDETKQSKHTYTHTYVVHILFYNKKNPIHKQSFRVQKMKIIKQTDKHFNWLGKIFNHMAPDIPLFQSDNLINILYIYTYILYVHGHGAYTHKSRDITGVCV